MYDWNYKNTFTAINRDQLVHHMGKKGVSKKKPPIIYVAERGCYTDDKTCFSHNILFSCPLNLKFRRVGKNVKGKLFSQIMFAFISLIRKDKAAVVSKKQALISSCTTSSVVCVQP